MGKASRIEHEKCRDKDFLIPIAIECFTIIYKGCEAKAERYKVLEMTKALFEALEALEGP